MLRVIRHHALTPVPWRNGGGVTREILTGPVLDRDPAWRISLADITADGPFSIFPETDRLITVAQGAGFELRFEDRAAPGHATLRADSEPFAFAGERHCACRLLAGPARALNVMTSRAHASATVEIVRLAAPTALATGSAQDTADAATAPSVTIIALGGAIGCAAQGRADTLAPLDALHARDAAAAAVQLIPHAEATRIALIRIRLRPAPAARR